MTNFKLKQLVKKKGILLPVLILCSLFICQNGFAAWDKKCCIKNYDPKQNSIKIYYKFFENNSKTGLVNSFLEECEIEYSMDLGINYTHLMTSSTEYQTTEDWAWIDLKNKKKRN